AVPATTAEDEAADARARAAWAARVEEGSLRAVAIGAAPEHHDGLAVLAVLARTECTDVLFHFVGPPHGDAQFGFADLEAHRKLAGAFGPPDPSDAPGPPSEPVAREPVSSRSPGGIPDPDRLRVITGVWRYQPPAPDDAASFVAELGTAR